MPEPFTAAAARLSGVDRQILTEAADRFDIVAKEAASRVVGGGAVMRLHGRGGRRIPVQLGTVVRQAASAVVIDGTPKAQWVWITDGTKRHRIGRKRRFLHGSGYSHPVRGPVIHPGSRGQGAWMKAVAKFRIEYPDIVVDEVKKALRGGR